MLSLVAGSETTASVMRITFLYLISSPTIYNKLKATVKEVVSSGTVAEPISYEMAREIPYLRVSLTTATVVFQFDTKHWKTS